MVLLYGRAGHLTSNGDFRPGQDPALQPLHMRMVQQAQQEREGAMAQRAQEPPAKRPPVVRKAFSAAPAGPLHGRRQASSGRGCAAIAAATAAAATAPPPPELSAGVAALRRGDFAAAREIFTTLDDVDVFLGQVRPRRVHHIIMVEIL